MFQRPYACSCIAFCERLCRCKFKCPKKANIQEVFEEKGFLRRKLFQTEYIHGSDKIFEFLLFDSLRVLVMVQDQFDKRFSCAKNGRVPILQSQSERKKLDSK